ncbi:hypothetical protein L0668_10450 [Paraglaciecola aquimarina]|uniref:DUF904 domain-containing protein n=1 Tax=Paraglaciecola algarum TaxID=3050085 RepID=A0ABS9D815_9ALTE|nr:hypothetical protein [Paraglaciecola sp. G1-23]MCF2948527.1 hypothetical protein [Paraglaciecola sp. G1-23]
MPNVNQLSTERLRALITDTESTLKRLLIELENRQFIEQENQIQHLEEHIKGAELSLSTIRDFLALVIAQNIQNKK